MAQLSDDCFARGGQLMRTDKALELLAGSIICVTEPVPAAVAQALGHILAEDVSAPHDVPPGDNSAVDGYAVFFDDLDPQGETALPIVGPSSRGPSPGRTAQARRDGAYLHRRAHA